MFPSHQQKEPAHCKVKMSEIVLLPSCLLYRDVAYTIMFRNSKPISWLSEISKQPAGSWVEDSCYCRNLQNERMSGGFCWNLYRPCQTKSTDYMLALIQTRWRCILKVFDGYKRQEGLDWWWWWWWRRHLHWRRWWNATCLLSSSSPACVDSKSPTKTVIK